MNLHSPTVFFGTIIAVEQVASGVQVTVERPDATKDVVVMAHDSEEAIEVILEQLTQHCLGKRMSIIGNHISSTGEGTLIEPFHIAEVKTPFIERVLSVAEEMAARKSYGCELRPIKGFDSLEDWFTALHTALFDVRYKEVAVPGVGKPIAIERDDKARLSFVNITFEVPTGEVTLRSITQSPLEANEYGEMAENGTRITWFVFDYVPVNSVKKSIRAGRVQDGQVLWGETAKERLTDVFRKPVTVEAAGDFVARTSEAGNHELEVQAKTAGEAVAKAACEESTGLAAG